MRLSNLSGREVHMRSARVVLTTGDIANLLGVSENVVRRRISTGKLKFTGEGVSDFRYLVSLVS